MAGKFTDITHAINTARTEAAEASQVAGVALASADGKNTNHYGTTQPTQARLGDVWFKDNGEQIGIWIYRVTDTGKPGWVALATDLNHALVSAELEQAKTEVAQAKQAAKQAGDIAGQAQANVAKATSDIAAARKQADQAVKTASQASEGVEGLKITLSDNLQNVWGSIAMMSNNINLRVGIGEVINRINISLSLIHI